MKTFLQKLNTVTGFSSRRAATLALSLLNVMTVVVQWAPTMTDL